MKTVMSVRLDEESLARVRELARKDKKDLSTLARELIGEGLVLVALRDYRDGKLSLALLARRLAKPLAEVIDLLSDLGVQSPIEYDDYLQSLGTAAQVVGDARDSKGSH